MLKTSETKSKYFYRICGKCNGFGNDRVDKDQPCLYCIEGKEWLGPKEDYGQRSEVF